MKVVVMGYHDIGYICLRELLAAGADIRAVVTHADNPGEAIWFRSVRDLAFERCLPVFQPPDVNAPAMVEAMRRIAPDVIFSFYFRQMLGRAILDIPPAGAFNLHGSLLPRYRGRCPVNWVLVRGESETGVTLHRMEIKADSGPILAQARVPIDFTDSARTLFDKMTDAAAALMRETWPRMLRGEITETPQDHAAASYFGGRSQKDGLIDWGRPATAIYNLVRAVTHPYPGAFTLVPGGRRLFVWWAEPDDGAPTGGAAPGTVLSPRRPGAIDVATGKGVLRIVRAQAEGGEEEAAAGAIDIPTGAVLG